jgi:DNA-directed RNA polymerase beta subunit/DNA-directed RNA polymerase beta' subunit
MSELTPQQSFETLKSNVVDTIQSYFPFEGSHHKLVVDNVRVEDNLRSDDVSSQAEAKDKEGTWGVPIRADVKLLDKVTGKVIDSKKNQVIARLPKLTNRYGFIVNGNEYQVDHLFRLKSGVYSRVQDNGDLETEFNLAKKPTGKNFSVKLDPDLKKFTIKLDGAHVPLYPVLKAAGVSDDQIEQSWGKEIFAANKPKTEMKFDKSLQQFWDHTSEEGGAAPTDRTALIAHVNKFFDGTVLRPDTTAITLGHPVSKVDGQVLQMAANKILGVSRGTLKPDDRDSLVFKEVASVEDFVPEKIARSAYSIRSRLRNVIDNKQTTGEILSSELFNHPIHDFFLKGGSVAERSDQTNPIQMLSSHRKTTLMSKELGGINSERKINDDMRRVNATHIGFLDPIHTPESDRTGITLHLASGVKKNGKDLETSVYNLASKKLEWTKVVDLNKATAILPDQVKWVNGKPIPISKNVKVKLPGGEVAVRPASEATHVLPSSKAMFNYATNLVPFLPCNQGNRVSMADKQIEQAISLKDREAPLVQTRTDSPSKQDSTFEKLLGGFVSQKALEDGTVASVKNNVVTIKEGNGEKHEVHLYDHFPLNDPKGQMHSELVVKAGDKVKKGQLLADTNFTKGGVLAYGTNLRVGYIPFKGYNFEDGIVISETAATKLTSDHLYKKNLEVEPDTDFISKVKLRAHAVVRSTQIPKEHWNALDDEGIIKVGSKVLPGQILVAAVGKNMATKSTHAWGALGKKALSPFKDKSLIWDEDHVGEVTKVIKQSGGRGVKVYVKTEEPAVIGDKLSGRHGNKGIITLILPDHEMPFTKDTQGEKRHLEVALNPSGVPTRINVGQVLETAAAKIAEKTGKPYIVNNFAGEGYDYRQHVMDDLKQHGLSDEEMVFDPKDTRKALGSVLVGPQYIFKLKHQVEKKLSVRGGGTDLNNRSLPYDIDKQPTKGGERGGQGFGALEMYSLLGHNARHNIREMATYKSDQQDMPFWSMVQEGHEPPPPHIPFAYKKFEALLKGLGVNVTKEGTAVRLLPMTNKEILHLAGNGRNEIRDGSKTLLAKNLKPEAGGLFDPVATGGVDGDKWSFLRLAEPVPNPIFVGHNNMPGPVPALLGLKMSEINEVMSGRMKIDGKTGGKALEAALKKIDVDTEIKKLKESMPTLREAPLDRANKKMKYLLALKDAGLLPHEAYILHNIPVLPPKFRPATTTPTGDVNYSSLNGLYKNISLLNDRIRSHDAKVMPESELQPLRTQIWDSMKALQSVGSYRPVYDVDRSGNRELKGILDIIGGGEGEQPKEGFFQAKLVKRKQDLSMRSTIVPEPALSIDEVGLPKNAAMELYKPFVVAQLHKWGMTPLAAQDEMRKGTPLAFKALEHAAHDHLVILKRDPALHKANVQAFHPKLVEGKAIQIHPLICGGFNADFDGDSCTGNILLASGSEKSYSAGQGELTVPHTGRIVSYQVIDIANFPRLSESKVVKPSGVVEYDVPAEVYVPAYQNGKMEIMPVSKFSIHPNCEEWKVETKNGRELTCSQDHSLALLDPETLEVHKAPAREAVGLCAPTMRSLQEPEMFSFFNGGSVQKNGRQMEERVPLSFCNGWFIGCCAGDGWSSDERQLHLASGVASGVRGEWSRLADELSRGACVSDLEMPHDFDGKDCFSIRTTVSSSALSRFIEPLIGKGAHNKHLPYRFLEMPEEFRRGLFCGLIDTDGSANWSKRGQFALQFTSTSQRLIEETMLLGLSLGLHSSKTEYENRESPAFVLTFSIRPVQDARWIKLFSENKRKALEELWSGEQVSQGRNDFVPMTPKVRTELLDLLRTVGASVRPPRRNDEAFSQYVILKREEPTLTRQSVSQLKTLVGGLLMSDYLRKWFALVADSTIGWDLVTKADFTGRLVEMYDLTVPEAWTFTMADGLVVWDTMAATVPFSHEAIEEARKMLPSANLFSPGTGGVMYNLDQEQVIGLHYLAKWGKKIGKTFETISEAKKAESHGDIGITDVIKIKGAPETTVGRLMIAEKLPSGFSRNKDILHDADLVITKGFLSEEISKKVAKEQPNHFAKTVDGLKDLGNEYSFRMGTSFGLKDFAPLKGREAILARAHKNVAALKHGGDAKELESQTVDIYQKATKELEDAAEKGWNEGDNRLSHLVHSGARGKKEQLRQMISAPMLMQDSSNRIIPTPVTRSYAEGLDFGDYWLTQHGARKGTLQRSQGTSEPGAITKDIINSTMNTLIVSNDCKTNQGVLMDITHRDVHDRYLAAPYKLKDGTTIRAGSLVTPEITSRLKNSKVDRVLVRSPLKCAHGEGICAKCFGLNENGSLHDVGTNIGVLAGQAIGEPASQMSMDSFHSGGVAMGAGAGSVGAFTRLHQIVMMPEILKNAATLSSAAGPITDVKKDAAGGVDIYVGTARHHVPVHLVRADMKVGAEVKKGQKLSHGFTNPHALMDATGDIHAVQNYLTSALHSQAVSDPKSSDGPGLFERKSRRRNIEVVVRALTNLTKIKDPGHSDYIRGDVVPRSEVEEHNRNLPKGKRPIEHKPFLKGVSEIPRLINPNWMARLNYQELPSTIQQAASYGSKADIHGAHPIPGMAMGASFGRPPEELRKRKPYVY